MTPSPLLGADCLVTGAAGFIGSHLCDRLVAEGARVHALVRTVSRVRAARLAHVDDQLEIVEADLRDGASLRALVGRVRPQYVFHLGAYTHVGRSFGHVGESLQTNITGTVDLLQALREDGYISFVNVGTSEIYGAAEVPFREDMPVAPLSPYAVAKYAAERYCRMFHQAYGWPIVLIRPFNAYGARQSPDRIIPELIAAGLTGSDLEMTHGLQTREFNEVTDLVDGLVRAALAGPRAHGEVINLGCGEEHSMREVAAMVLSEMGEPVRALFGALPERPTEIPRMFCDNSKAERLLGWAPRVSLEEGLRRTIAFYTAEAERPDSPYLPRGGVGREAPARAPHPAATAG